MPNINKVFVNAETHPFKDDVSGYGIFSAQQTMPSTTAGATLIASVGYRSFSTTTQTFGATQSVDFYSTGGSVSGNDWTATVDGTNLILSSGGSGSIDPIPITPALGTMPNLSSQASVAGCLTVLKNAGIISLSGTTYTVLCGELNFTYAATRLGKISSKSYVNGATFSSLITDYSNNFVSQSPAALRPVYATTTVEFALNQSSGGGVTTMVEPDYPSVTGEVSI